MNSLGTSSQRQSFNPQVDTDDGSGRRKRYRACWNRSEISKRADMATTFPEILAVPAELSAPNFARTRARARRAEHRPHPRTVLSPQVGGATESVRQVIPSVVRNGARLLCVKRAQKGRDDLRLRYTLLFGGHVDAEDATGDRDHILHRCAERELREELGLRATVSPDPIGVVVDLETASSRRHFVVFECRITASAFEKTATTPRHSRYDNDYPLMGSNELATRIRGRSCC